MEIIAESISMFYLHHVQYQEFGKAISVESFQAYYIHLELFRKLPICMLIRHFKFFISVRSSENVTLFFLQLQMALYVVSSASRLSIFELSYGLSSSVQRDSALLRLFRIASNTLTIIVAYKRSIPHFPVGMFKVSISIHTRYRQILYYSLILITEEAIRRISFLKSSY